MNQLVSIIIPCFNAERWISATLDSALAQTHSNLEVIVVDDGSSDGSLSVIHGYKDDRLLLIEKKNAGAGAARNTGFNSANGDYILFLDSDDLIDKRNVEIQLSRLQNTPNSVACGSWGRFYNDPSEVIFNIDDTCEDLAPVEWLVRSRRLGLPMHWPARWLIPRSVAVAAGPWDESPSPDDDGEYLTRVILASDQVLFCPDARGRYRSGNQGSLSGQRSAKHLRGRFRSLELCEGYVRAREDSARVRQGFALSWQHLAHSSYPYAPALSNEASARAAALDPIRIQPDGGTAFKWTRRLLGWKAARRLQVLSGRP
jgi:glycosyltransferase involved in cell wall biosynthesis